MTKNRSPVIGGHPPPDRIMSTHQNMIEDLRRTIAELDAEYDSLAKRMRQVQTTRSLLVYLDRQNHSLLSHIARSRRIANPPVINKRNRADAFSPSQSEEGELPDEALL